MNYELTSRESREIHQSKCWCGYSWWQLNDLYIHGEKVALDAEQQARQLKKYRDSMNEYLPRAKQMANDSLALANDVIDDILLANWNSPESFDNVKEINENVLCWIRLVIIKMAS